jgi:hypothetical protein
MFIKEFVKYAKPLTDAPEEFHFLAAQSLISVTVGRRAHINFSFGKMYMNTFLMAVAPPSTRKTTVHNIMLPILEAIGKGDAILPMKSTPEQLFNNMAIDSNRLYTIDEYSIFLTDSRKNYNEGIINDMVKLYDCPDKYEVGRVEMNITITLAYLNQLVFIQPEAFEKQITDYHFGIGLPQRFQIVFVEKFQKRPRRKTIAQDKQAQQQIIARLKIIDTHLADDVEVCFTDDLSDYIFQHVEDHYDKQLSSDPMLNSFPARFADQVYKLAALTAIDEATMNATVKIDRVDVSLANVQWAIETLTQKYFTPFIDHAKQMRNSTMYNYTEYKKLLEKVKRLITKHGGQIDHSKLLQYGNFKVDKLKKFMTQAMAENQLKIVNVGGKTVYRIY